MRKLSIVAATQDDAHIFCLPTQIASEIKAVLDLVENIMGAFGFKDFEVNLSTRPEKAVGSDDIWRTAEAALVEALQSKVRYEASLIKVAPACFNAYKSQSRLVSVRLATVGLGIR